MSTQKERGGGHPHLNSPPNRKPLFSEDEKVLCYEPDQKKAQVLYDSKVLEVVERKEANGKMHYEYKIHFQGWNSSWDRYVREENVLKDTDENRNLQRELNVQAQLLCRTSVKKKNKKKTILEKLKAAASLSKESNGLTSKTWNHFYRGENSANHHNSSDPENNGSDPEQYSSDEDDGPKPTQHLHLPPNLKKILEQDFLSAKKLKQKLLRIPARWTVVELLESYVSFVGRSELQSYTSRRQNQKSAPSGNASGIASAQGNGKLSGSMPPSKNLAASRSQVDLANEDLINTFQRINRTKKIIEDIRVMFDFLLYQILLFEHENEQYNQFLQEYPKLSRLRKLDVQPSMMKIKSESIEVTEKGTAELEPPTKRRKISAFENGKVALAEQIEEKNPGKSGNSSEKYMPQHVPLQKLKIKCELNNRCEFPWACEQLNKYMDELSIYRMLPPEALSQGEFHPSLSYGVVHLLRLFVKMPDILSKTTISHKKLRIVLGEMNRLLWYLSSMKGIISPKDWYDPKTKMYEEDFYDETCHLRRIGQKIPDSNSEILIHTKKNTDYRKSTGKTTILRSLTRAEIRPTKDHLIRETGANTVLKVDSGRHFVKRNPPRASTGKISESIMIDGNALGVRKSLSIEELSRETLVAANNTDCNKSYSLRMHCRIPYK